MGVKIEIVVDEDVLKQLVFDYLEQQIGCSTRIGPKDVQIQTKSAQNYRSEWETAAFRARIVKEL